MKTNVLSGMIFTALFLAVTTTFANYDPHPKGIDYSENYRGQYHFSPKSEWMNDINGLMYQGGKYHMIYQWGKSKRHGGYATSPDLLHWTDEGVALIPQESFLPKEAKRNVSGAQVYSGSGVVVSGQTAEKITGSSKEAMVAIYTGTKLGTCLAWSNDGGKTWHDYKNNPVANPTKGADPRDPCVFWHEPTKKWVLAIYEHGTTFYGSTDLIAWNKLSNIKFGFECPDVYEIPLDGDKKKNKWILQDANGSYLVGNFDGVKFTPEQEKLVMDVGPDFYAAQTFFRPTMPTDKLIQIAWNDHWNGGIGEKPWNRNATFPVELGLVSYDGKMRLTRTPIPAIKSLYQSTKKWSNKTIHGSGKGKNILNGIASKAFDLTAQFDLSGSTARGFEFKIANKTVYYDIVKQELMGKSLKTDSNNRLTVRMLVDWGQLEVFSAGGVFSYSQQFPFNPADSSVSLYAIGGEVKLVSMELNEVARTWPEIKKHKTKKPNILVLISDDQRWDQLSYADKPIIPELKTPNMDSLAQQGAYFRNAFITTPICAVSRACIMTGRYVSTHGMNHFGTPLAPDVLSKTYPALLHDNGYRTGILGKWGMAVDGTEKVFDVFNAWMKQGKYFHETDKGKIHNAEWLAERTKEFLESSTPDKPFCLTVCYKSPHHPYQPDERDKDLFDDVVIPKRKTDTPEAYKAMAPHVMEKSLNRWCYFDERKDEATKDDFEKNFLRCVMSLDRSVGKIMQTLKDLDLDDNTVVVFLSDHGYQWGEHGLGGKWLLYEESIRTPIMIRGPGIADIKPGTKLDDLALNIDIAPTILDIAGIPIPSEMDGKSLYPLLSGQDGPFRKDFFMEHVDVIKVSTPIPDSRGVRTDEWKYIRYVNVEPEVEELYNIKTDPLESRNLANDAKYAGIKEKLRQRYNYYLKTLQKQPK